MVVGKQAWLEGARLTVERAGWTHHEILADSGADDFTQVIGRNTRKRAFETSAGTIRWRDGKIAEVWSVGHKVEAQ
jgi:hypothetical protein